MLIESEAEGLVNRRSAKQKSAEIGIAERPRQLRYATEWSLNHLALSDWILSIVGD